MNFTHFGSLFLGPMMLFSSFFGLAHHDATSTQFNVNASTTASWMHFWDHGNDKNKSNDQDGSATSTNPGKHLGEHKHKGGYATTTPAVAPSISSLSPTSGPVGTQVTINGSNFATSSIVHFGGGVVRNPVVAADGSWITFTIPSSVGPYCGPRMMCAMYVQLVRPGTYNVSVQTPEGTGLASSADLTSNALAFTVTSTTSTGGSLSVTGIDAPATLTQGTTGTWTVHASSPGTLLGDLHYSVVWGDQITPALFTIQANDTTISSSATFTHVYASAGTYTPIFTVTDDAGHTATASATVVVQPVY